MFPGLSSRLTPITWLLAVATMTVGDGVPIAQGNIKRMLVYSIIAHAGYFLVALWWAHPVS